jgi:hypothetical protein
LEQCQEEMHAIIRNGGLSMAWTAWTEYQRLGRGVLACSHMDAEKVAGCYVRSDALDTIPYVSAQVRAELESGLQTYDPRTEFVFCMSWDETPEYAPCTVGMVVVPPMPLAEAQSDPMQVIDLTDPGH